MDQLVKGENLNVSVIWGQSKVNDAGELCFLSLISKVCGPRWLTLLSVEELESIGFKFREGQDLNDLSAKEKQEESSKDDSVLIHNDVQLHWKEIMLGETGKIKAVWGHAISSDGKQYPIIVNGQEFRKLGFKVKDHLPVVAAFKEEELAADDSLMEVDIVPDAQGSEQNVVYYPCNDEKPDISPDELLKEWEDMKRFPSILTKNKISCKGDSLQEGGKSLGSEKFAFDFDGVEDEQIPCMIPVIREEIIQTSMSLDSQGEGYVSGISFSNEILCEIEGDSNEQTSQARRLPAFKQVVFNCIPSHGEKNGDGKEISSLTNVAKIKRKWFEMDDKENCAPYESVKSKKQRLDTEFCDKKKNAPMEFAKTKQQRSKLMKKKIIPKAHETDYKERKFLCTIGNCAKKFMKRKGLNRHLKTHDKKPDRDYCDFCKKNFMKGTNHFKKVHQISG